MARFEDSDANKTSTGCLLVVCIVFAVLVAVVANKGGFLPVHTPGTPYPSESVTSTK